MTQVYLQRHLPVERFQGVAFKPERTQSTNRGRCVLFGVRRVESTGEFLTYNHVAGYEEPTIIYTNLTWSVPTYGMATYEIAYKGEHHMVGSS